MVSGEIGEGERRRRGEEKRKRKERINRGGRVPMKRRARGTRSKSDVKTHVTVRTGGMSLSSSNFPSKFACKSHK